MHSTFEPWFFAWAKPFTGYVVLQAALTLYLHPLSLRAQVFLCKVRVSAATRATKKANAAVHSIPAALTLHAVTRRRIAAGLRSVKVFLSKRGDEAVLSILSGPAFPRDLTSPPDSPRGDL